MYSRNKRGERRVSSQIYKRLTTIHVLVSVGWLGISVSKLALAIAAITSDSAAAFYRSMEVVNWALRPAAVATLVTGGLLSLGTKWGLLQHYWVATKLFLTVLAIATSGALLDLLIQQSKLAASGQLAPDGGVMSDASQLARLVVSLSATHVVMLGVATVLSVYKPWGKTRFAWRKSERISPGTLS